MRTRLWTVVALTGGLVLTGCGSLPNGAASVVNGHTITRTQVDDLTDAQCVAATQAAEKGQSRTTPRAQVQVFSLQLLVDIELSEQYGRDLGITPEPSVAKGFYAQLKGGIDPLPATARQELTDVFTDWARGRAVLVEVGADRTGKPVSLDNFGQLLNAGLQARESWLKGAKLTTDPRYGPNAKGYPTDQSGSVSKGVSDFAKQAAKSTPSSAWVATLPAGQRCG